MGLRPGGTSEYRTAMFSQRGFRATRIEWGKMSAGGSILIVPLTVLFYSIQRFLIHTLTLGAIAG
jgi:ABC-type maltose transport system permease subunit